LNGNRTLSGKFDARERNKARSLGEACAIDKAASRRKARKFGGGWKSALANGKGLGKFRSSHATATAGLRTSHANGRTGGTPPRCKPVEFAKLAIRRGVRRKNTLKPLPVLEFDIFDRCALSR
jgi:hypothetical protein